MKYLLTLIIGFLLGLLVIGVANTKINKVIIQDTTYNRIALDSIKYNITEIDSIIVNIKKQNEYEKEEALNDNDSIAIRKFEQLVLSE